MDASFESSNASAPETGGETPTTTGESPRRRIARRRRAPRPAWRPYAWSLLGGLLLSMAFVDARWSIVVWPAVALLIGLAERAPVARAAGLGLVFGLGFCGPSLFWMAPVTTIGYGVLVLYRAAYVAAFAGGLSWIVRRGRVPAAVAAPLLWVALEYICSWLLTGFPWLLLAHAQVDAIALVQIADVTGAAGIGFLIVFVAAAMANMSRAALFKPPRLPAASRAAAEPGDPETGWTHRHPYVLALISVLAVFLVLTYGIFAVGGPRAAGGTKLCSLRVLRVLLIQSNAPTPRHPAAATSAERDDIDRKLQRTLISMTRDALAKQADKSDPRHLPDLVVWPETLLSAEVDHDPAWRAELEDFVTEIGVPLLAGGNTEVRDAPGARPSASYNTATLFSPDGKRLSRYAKRHLVPFGEYVPWPLGSLVNPIAHEGYDAGRDDPPPMSLPLLRKTRGVDRPVKLAVNICYESAFASLIRGDVRRGGGVLMNLTNDGWFDGTHELVQHAAIARLRAIENRRPLIRATNSGLTLVVDSAGRVTDALPIGQPDSLLVTVPLPPADRELTFYNKFGDVFAILCLMASVGCLSLTWRRRGSQ